MNQNLLYPIFLKLKDRQVLVVGSGMVAYQKLIALINTEAKLTVIAPIISDEVRDLDGEFPNKRNIKFLEREYEWGDEKDFFLVITATDIMELNYSIANRCRDQGILVNCADSTEHCDFYIPSVVESGDVKVAISTNAKAPSVAQKLRKDLQGFVGVKYAHMVSIISEFREKVHEKYSGHENSKKRTQLLRRFTERVMKE
jgi:precorrin-2 dehydrogenase / sirohydrochlorin ferrochelatase